MSFVLLPFGLLQSYLIVISFHQGTHYWIDYGLASILAQSPLVLLAPDWAGLCGFLMYVKLLGTIRFLDPSSYEYMAVCQMMVVLTTLVMLLVQAACIMIMHTRFGICITLGLNGMSVKWLKMDFEEYRVRLLEKPGAFSARAGRTSSSLSGKSFTGAGSSSTDMNFWKKLYFPFRIAGYGEEGRPKGLLVLRKVRGKEAKYTLHVCPASTAVAATSYRYSDEVRLSHRTPATMLLSSGRHTLTPTHPNQVSWISIDEFEVPVPATCVRAIEEAFKYRDIVWTDCSFPNPYPTTAFLRVLIRSPITFHRHPAAHGVPLTLPSLQV